MHKHVRIEHHGQVHAMAFCTKCEWNDDDYTTAVRNANKHAKETGHPVRVEKGTAYIVVPTNTNQYAQK